MQPMGIIGNIGDLCGVPFALFQNVIFQLTQCTEQCTSCFLVCPCMQLPYFLSYLMGYIQTAFTPCLACGVM